MNSPRQLGHQPGEHLSNSAGQGKALRVNKRSSLINPLTRVYLLALTAIFSFRSKLGHGWPGTVALESGGGTMIPLSCSSKLLCQLPLHVYGYYFSPLYSVYVSEFYFTGVRLTFLEMGVNPYSDCLTQEPQTRPVHKYGGEKEIVTVSS